MQIDINELIELVKSVKPMFLNHTEAEHVTVKGRADFVTQVDIRVQEYMRNELSKRWPDVQFMARKRITMYSYVRLSIDRCTATYV